MLVAAVSGILMHRHLFTDIFTLRGRDRMVGLRDLHSVAGTWTLPHAFVLAFTGAYLSFAIAVGLPMLAKIAFKGDVRQMVTTLNGHPASQMPARPQQPISTMFSPMRAGVPARRCCLPPPRTAAAPIRASPFSRRPNPASCPRRGSSMTERPVRSFAKGR